MESAGKLPEPHFRSPLGPGLSKARPVQVEAPATLAVPVIRKTAESPTGSPTNGFWSGGFLNVTRVAPLIGPRSASQPCPCVWPLTDTTAAALTAKELGTSICTQVISSPPPFPPTFRTVSVTAT
jgi:hypothetical protein